MFPEEHVQSARPRDALPQLLAEVEGLLQRLRDDADVDTAGHTEGNRALVAAGVLAGVWIDVEAAETHRVAEAARDQPSQGDRAQEPLG